MPPTSKIHRQKLLYIPQIYRLWIMEKRLWCMKRFSNDKIYKDEDIMNKKKSFSVRLFVLVHTTVPKNAHRIYLLIS